MRMCQIIFGFCLLVVLSACGKSVTSTRDPYVGSWEGEKMFIDIPKEGSVSYRAYHGSIVTTAEGKIVVLDGQRLKFGIREAAVDLQIQKPPFQEDGKWKMVLDGVELTKK